MAYKSYSLNKKESNDYNTCSAVIDNRHLRGFKVNPKNQERYYGIEVKQMTVIKPSFIEKVLKKKIKRRLDSYLQYIIQVMENDDDGSGIRIALNDLERYRRVIKNKYRMYLDEKYVELLLKKIALIERELKIKNYYYERQDILEEEQVKGRSR